GGPFHEEKGQFAMFDIGETPAGDVGEAGEGYAIEDVAAEIEARVAAKGGGIGVAAVAGAGEDAVARGRIGGQAQVAFNFLLVPPPEVVGSGGVWSWKLLGMIGAVGEHGFADLGEITLAKGEGGGLLDMRGADESERREDGEPGGECHGVDQGEGGARLHKRLPPGEAAWSAMLRASMATHDLGGARAAEGGRMIIAFSNRPSSKSDCRSLALGGGPGQNAMMGRLASPRRTRSRSVKLGGPMKETMTAPGGLFLMRSQNSPEGTTTGRRGSMGRTRSSCIGTPALRR